MQGTIKFWRRRQAWLRRLFSTRDGKALLADMTRRTGAHLPAPATTDPIALAMWSARRDLVMEYVTLLEMTEHDLIELATDENLGMEG